MSLVTKGAIVVGGGAVFSQLIGSLIARLTEKVSTDIIAGGFAAIIAVGTDLVEPIWLGTWYLLSLWVILELRSELISLGKLLLQLIVHVLELLQRWWNRHQSLTEQVSHRSLDDSGGTDLD